MTNNPSPDPEPTVLIRVIHLDEHFLRRLLTRDAPSQGVHLDELLTSENADASAVIRLVRESLESHEKSIVITRSPVRDSDATLTTVNTCALHTLGTLATIIGHSAFLDELEPHPLSSSLWCEQIESLLHELPSGLITISRSILISVIEEQRRVLLSEAEIRLDAQIVSGRDLRSVGEDSAESFQRFSQRAAGNQVSGPSWVPPASGVPVRSRDEPLPHDGLFVRRNNAFGTRASMGIADLIENGVLIDQTQIRFDDFVASRSDEVPSPPAGEAVAVSHGCAEPPGDAKARESTTHFLEIALRAADHAPDTPRGEVLPVNFVFAVDTSASMFGEKLDTVKSALHQLYEQLRDIDILGIVTFDTRVSTVLKATPKRELSLERLTQVISGLTATGGTDLNLGLRYGIDEIARYGNDRLDLVNCLYLFSDGDPTSGETDWVQIRKNVAERLRGDLTLSCFGFGTDARTRELQALAGLTGGHCTFVTDPGEVRLNLAEDLTRREHLAAINVQLRIEIDPDIRVWHLYGHDLITDPAAREAVLQEAREARRRGEEQSGAPGLPDLITGEKGIRIFAPDLAYGETYWIVLEIELPDGTTPEDALGSATVQYVDVLARDNRRHEWSLTPAGTISAQTVAVHAIGLWTSEITFYALDDLYEHDRATAKQRLSRHAEVLRNAYSTMRVPQLRDDRVTLIKLISLSGNLDQPATWHDPVGPADAMRGYAVHALNAFGRVRAGYTRHTPHT